jgi:poly(3-hydroxybutyrate) depolymerase
MLYNTYEFQRSWLAGAGAAASLGASWLNNPANPMRYMGVGEMAGAALDVFAHAAAPRGKPAFGLDTTLIDGKTVTVTESIECRKPFGQLKHFVRDGVAEGDPRVLIVAPMSGHFATLLRGTVERLLPTSDGRFDLDDYIDYLVEFLEHVGPGAHMLAVCQPSVPAYAAVALMSAANHPALPASLTMMGGPVDTRKAPTSVNTLATQRPFAWFEQNVIATVPAIYPGHGRKVYPGFLQLSGFMSMNLGNHMTSHWEMFKHLVAGDGASADATKDFYDEYRSVCDMTSEYYLQTISTVFQDHLLPRGEMFHRGTRVDPGAITKVALLAIEGERDDISGLGQTRAALDIATNLPDAKKAYYMAAGAGHYGIFNGSKWRDHIAPVVEKFIRSNGA